MAVRNRIEVMHGVNLDQLGRRDPAHYGGITFDELERRIAEIADELGLEARFFQTNHEGEFVEHLHGSRASPTGSILNPGAWTHYSWAIRDALELTGLPAVEVHLSDVESREPWRRESVIGDLCIARVSGKGVEGYREALERLKAELASVSARADRPSSCVAEAGLDALLVTDLLNVRYLTGYTGTNGLAVVGPATRAFVTDFRYVEQAAEQVDSSFDRRRAPAGPARLRCGRASVGRGTSRLRGRAHVGPPARAAARAAPRPRRAGRRRGARRATAAVKDADEIELMRGAAQLADAALVRLLERGLVGRTERQIAVALEHEMRVLGAEQPSFDSIVAAGAHGALPHASPRDVEIAGGELVVIDWGAQLDGYCSDCTRTVAAGEPGDVAAGGLRARARGAAGRPRGRQSRADAREVDGVARDVIEAAGHGEQFGHGLGHGVGLEVHEGPRLSQRSDDVLAAGNVVTVEPGVYLPGDFGVRIEDLVVVTDDGAEILTTVSKELTVVD